MALQVIYYYQMNHMALFPVIPTALTDILDLPKSIARHPCLLSQPIRLIRLSCELFNIMNSSGVPNDTRDPIGF